MPDSNFFALLEGLTLIYYIFVLVLIYIAFGRGKDPNRKLIAGVLIVDAFLLFVSALVLTTPGSSAANKAMAVFTAVMAVAVTGYLFLRLRKVSKIPPRSEIWPKDSYRVYRDMHIVPTHKSINGHDFWYAEKDGDKYALTIPPKFDENTAPEIRVNIVNGTSLRIVEKKTWKDAVFLIFLIISLFTPIISFLLYQNGITTNDPAHPVNITLPVMSLTAGLAWYSANNFVTQKDSYSVFLKWVSYLLFGMCTFSLIAGLIQALAAVL